MAYSKILAFDEWTADARHTAQTEQAVQMVNCSNWCQLAWLTTDDDTPPEIRPGDAPKIGVGRHDAVVLRAGERLWLAYPGMLADGARVTLQF